MRFKKTTTKKRDTYSYVYYDADGKQQKTTLVAGKDGVTAEDIKRLHAFDDAEVYNNIKNSKSKVQDWQKDLIASWMKAHPYDDLPNMWNLSLNEIVEEEKSTELEELLIAPNSMEDDSEIMERLHAIIDSLSEIQKNTYRKVVLEEMSNSAIAREEGKSEAAVRKIINRIKEIIAEDEELKKYYK